MDRAPSNQGSGQRQFAHGLSVEELKEMTKVRLQQQGRSSPTLSFTSNGRPASSGGLSSSGGGLGLGHDRTEWRRSGSAGSAMAMMEDHHRGLEEGPSAPGLFRHVFAAPACLCTLLWLGVRVS